MANATENSVRKDLPAGVPTERRINGVGPDGFPYGDAAHNTTRQLSIEELRLRNESLIENIGALRFSIARIEHLEAQKQVYVDMLNDVRPALQAAGYVPLDTKIGALLHATAD